MKILILSLLMLTSVNAFAQDPQCPSILKQIEALNQGSEEVTREIAQLRLDRSSGKLPAAYANAMIDSAREHRSRIDDAYLQYVGMKQAFSCDASSGVPSGN